MAIAIIILLGINTRSYMLYNYGEVLAGKALRCNVRATATCSWWVLIRSRDTLRAKLLKLHSSGNGTWQFQQKFMGILSLSHSSTSMCSVRRG